MPWHRENWMKIGIISFTKAGSQLAEKAGRVLEMHGYRCRIDKWQNGMSLSDWTRDCWKENQGIVFVGAAGIAVRTIAPFLKDKFTDPAVVVMDEKGRFAIPLASGHMGGANRLAEVLGQELHAIPVITTATDVNHLFAVDVFARENHLYLTDRRLAKQVSARLLEGNVIGWKADWGEFPVPKGFALPELDEQNGLTVWITISDQEKAGYLKLIPRAVVIGIGCRKGTDGEVLGRAVDQMLEQHHISRSAVLGVATIDIKEKEPAIAKLVTARGWELFSYTAEELGNVEGEFSESDFVKQTVGVGNVCERAVVCSGAELIAKKTLFSGITAALGVMKR